MFVVVSFAVFICSINSLYQSVLRMDVIGMPQGYACHYHKMCCDTYGKQLEGNLFKCVVHAVLDN